MIVESFRSICSSQDAVSTLGALLGRARPRSGGCPDSLGVAALDRVVVEMTNIVFACMKINKKSST